MFNRMFERRHAWFAVLLFAMFIAPAAAGAEPGILQVPTSTAVQLPVADLPGGELPVVNLPAGGLPTGVSALDERFTRLPGAVPLPEIPNDPVETLISALNAHSEGLGFPVDHGPAIRDSGMSPEYAGRVALLMQAVLTCDVADTDAKKLDCAAATQDAAAGVIQAKKEPNFRDVQAWPSLYIDGDGSKDYYRHDYSVLIDRGGNDTYDNNAGGNLQDILRGPEGSAALKHEPAIGCEHAQTLPPVPPGIAPPQDCISARQVVFIDQKSDSGPSDDVYGVFKPPRQQDDTNPLPIKRLVDGDCTNDPVIRRIVLEGSGFQGNGLLIDEDGNDKYRGKTASQGTGHIGVGVQRDLGGGNDDYLAIRNSQGFGLVASDGGSLNALGLLQDDGGNDRYHTYMPRPKDPNVPPQPPGSSPPGAGGVVDDLNNCDNLPRQVQGAGLLAGDGHLLDEDGQDVYEGSPPNLQDFLPPAVTFRHSSQGFGCDGGVGTLEDRGAERDTYRGGPKNRKDGATISETRTDCFALPGQGIFRDDGPKN